MKLNYKQLGQYIRQVDIRNTDCAEKNLLGVSVQKNFMPSIANTVGTDFSKYKVVKKGQFTYIPDTSRRGDKIGIALLEDYESGIVSNVYTVFEIMDEKELIPQYLMLWFKRPEFDRFARFKSHGSVREVIDWDEFCKIEIPVPSYDEQRTIVNSYRKITDRIALKKQINDNLAATIDAIFVEQFGKYTKLSESLTSSSNLFWLPEGWKLKPAEEFFDISIGKTPPRSEPEWFSYDSNDIIWISIADMKNATPFIFDSTEYLTHSAVKKHNIKFVPADSILLSFKMTVGRVAIVTEAVTTNEAIAHFPCSKDMIPYTYCYLKSFNYNHLGSTSSITTAINSKIIKGMPFLMPSIPEIELFNHKCAKLLDELLLVAKEINMLEQLKTAMISHLISHC